MFTFTATGLCGVEVCAETTVVVTNSPQKFVWEGYGLRLHFQGDSLPQGMDKCIITIQASLAGQYKFPDNHHLVSAIYWLQCEPRCNFARSISMEIHHCARGENTSKLAFVKAHSSQENLFYSFRYVGGCFSGDRHYGALELNSFCGMAIVQAESEERDYATKLFYLGQTSCFKIDWFVTWNVEAHLSVSSNRSR